MHNDKAVIEAVILHSNARVCLILPEYCSDKHRIRTNSNSDLVSSIVTFSLIDANALKYVRQI